MCNAYISSFSRGNTKRDGSATNVIQNTFGLITIKAKYSDIRDSEISREYAYNIPEHYSQFVGAM